MAEYDDRDDDLDDDRPRRGPGKSAADMVRIPAIGLIVTGVLGLLSVAYSFTQVGQFDANMQKEIAKVDANPSIPADQKKVQKDMIADITGVVKPLMIPLNVFQLVAVGLTLAGGVQMLRLKSRGLAMTGSIFAIISCFSGCCVTGLPFGIWALMTLGKPEVKAAFGGPTPRSTSRDDEYDDRDNDRRDDRR